MPSAPAQAGSLVHVLLALLVVVVVARVFGALFRRLEQPAVIGEVVAGIALGPSLLGRVAPDLAAFLLPPSVTPSLNVIAQVGVLLFMFLVGLDLDLGRLRGQARTAVAISHTSIVVPFALGFGLSRWLYDDYAPDGVPFATFATFMGVAMSITAFPVLARILTDRGLHKSKIGVLALTCAAVDDATAWCLLAIVVSLASPGGHGAWPTVVMTLGYVALAWTVARPLMVRVARAHDLRGGLGAHDVPLALVGVLGSALATEAIGIHAIFGAFLAGAVIPHESLLARTLRSRIEDVVLVLLLPAFFAITGLRTTLGLVAGAQAWLAFGAILAVACIGKVGGAYAAGRLTGLEAREAASIGVLMNTRGLMELVVLNLGLDLGVVSPTLFAMMVMMAMATTLATSPALTLLHPRASLGGEGASLADRRDAAGR